MDARQHKSAALLAGAVLDLASTRPIAELTVSQIAAHAGVHRSTFYEHAASPSDLLTQALRTELDDIRHQYLTGVEAPDVAAAVISVTEAVLRHVDAHAAVYTLQLGQLHRMLSDHFQRSALLVLSQDGLDLPQIDGIEPSVIQATSARYVADGTVGAIDVWLKSPAPRSTESFAQMFASLIPSWWPSGSAVAATGNS